LKRRRLLALAAFLLLLVAGGYAWLRVYQDSAAPVGLAEAVRGFRDRVPAVPAREAEGVPRFGVYAYRTEGFERVDSLLSLSHRYDETSTIAIEPAGCGIAERWQALTTRWDEVLSCPAAARRRLVSTEQHHEFFGSVNAAAYRCDGDYSARLRDLHRGDRWSNRCAGSSGTVSLSSTVTGMPVVRSDGRPVRAVRIFSVALVDGESRGRTNEVDIRRRSDGLLLSRSVHTRVQLEGGVGGTYEEDYSLRLLSARPRV
jgi:hypothetical protein